MAPRGCTVFKIPRPTEDLGVKEALAGSIQEEPVPSPELGTYLYPYIKVLIVRTFLVMCPSPSQY